jgi:hypothetical protein
MGYSLSLVAIKNCNAEAVYSVLDLRPTGEWEEIPESKIVGAELPTGWHLILSNRKEMGDGVLKRLSGLGGVVYCFVEDHAMYCRASGWRKGETTWPVTHDSAKGRYHLEIKGAAPASLDGLRRKQVSRQDTEGGKSADIDFIYDVPADLAKDQTGFRHDQEIPGMSGDAFQVLEPNPNKKKMPLLSRLLARILIDD